MKHFYLSAIYFQYSSSIYEPVALIIYTEQLFLSEAVRYLLTILPSCLCVQRMDESVVRTVTCAAALSELQRLCALTPGRPWVGVNAALGAPGLSCAAGRRDMRIAAAEEASLKWRLLGGRSGREPGGKQTNRWTG